MLYLPAEFPQEPEICYLNHAAVGPWPRRTAQAVADFAFQNMQRGGTDYPERLDVERRVRDRLARLINAASPDDIALVQNTSVGLSIVSQGLDWRDGDEVVGTEVAGAFGLTHLKSVVAHERPIRRVALCTGSGASLMREIEADCFLTGDIKYHDAMEAKVLGLNMIDIGHFESERYFGEILQKDLKNLGLTVIISSSKNPFTYL